MDKPAQERDARLWPNDQDQKQTNRYPGLDLEVKTCERKRQPGSRQRSKKNAQQERHFRAGLSAEESEPRARRHPRFTMALKPADSMLLRAASAAF